MRSLRGKEAKEKFVRDYTDVQVFAYVVLPKGCKRKSQCGGKLTDRCYHFSAVCKKTQKQEQFFLGYDCGKQLMKMLNIPAVKLFNPFVQTHKNAKTKGATHHANNIKEEFTPLGKELFDLINLTYMGLKLKDFEILDSISIKIRNKANENPKARYFASVNTILGEFHSTIQKILEKLQKNNPQFRKFDFTASRTYLAQYFKEKNRNDTIRF